MLCSLPGRSQPGHVRRLLLVSSPFFFFSRSVRSLRAAFPRFADTNFPRSEHVALLGFWTILVRFSHSLLPSLASVLSLPYILCTYNLHNLEKHSSSPLVFQSSELSVVYPFAFSRVLHLCVAL